MRWDQKTKQNTHTHINQKNNLSSSNLLPYNSHSTLLGSCTALPFLFLSPVNGFIIIILMLRLVHFCLDLLSFPKNYRCEHWRGSQKIAGRVTSLLYHPFPSLSTYFIGKYTEFNLVIFEILLKRQIPEILRYLKGNKFITKRCFHKYGNLNI